MTDPREPFETDSPVEGAHRHRPRRRPRSSERGSVDLETGAGETGAAEGSSDTADLDTATEVSDVTPEIEGGDADSLVERPAGRARRRLRRAEPSRPRTRTRPRR